MQEHPSFWKSKGKRSLWHSALAYPVVPLTAPTLLVLRMICVRSTRNMLPSDWVGIVGLYAVFSFAAMVVPGIPLLILFSRLHWGDFFAFIVGGAFCAATTYTFVAWGQMQRD